MSDNEISNSGRHAIYFDTQEKVDALKLLSKALQAANKQKLMKDVEQAIKLETENPQANKNKILSILAKVSSETLNKGSELAAIGNFAIALIQFFHGQPIDPTLLITLKQIFKVS